jgi:hypothetical protein
LNASAAPSHARGQRAEADVEVARVRPHAVERDETGEESDDLAHDGVQADLRIAHEIEGDSVVTCVRDDRRTVRKVADERAHVGEVDGARLDDRRERRLRVTVHLHLDVFHPEGDRHLLLGEDDAVHVHDDRESYRRLGGFDTRGDLESRGHGVDLDVTDFARLLCLFRRVAEGDEGHTPVEGRSRS